MGNSRVTRRVVATLTATSLSCTGAGLSAAAAPDSDESSGLAHSLAVAIAQQDSTVRGARFSELPPLGNPATVTSTPMGSFPQSGETFAVLSTGDASVASQPNTGTSLVVSNGGGPIRGGARDAVVLEVDVDVPTYANCASVNFRFLSKEYPEYVGSAYNDAFLIEVDESTWQVTAGGEVDAPRNFAFDPAGDPITINSTGATSMTTMDAGGTFYNGATPLLTAAAEVGPGAHTFFFTIFDQGDDVLDSAAFVDNLRFFYTADPATQCVPGAKPSANATTVPLLAAHGITGTPEDMDIVLDRSLGLVPSLDEDDVRSANTDKVTSVWTNGSVIADDAATLSRETGQPRVNVIAHSKGGLDARVALWENPNAFRGLGMLATPNGGSTGADNLCAIRRLPIFGDEIVEDQGLCDSPDDGLFNLQTGYMEDVFNVEVRDWPQHIRYVTAGDCTGWSTAWSCQAANVTLTACKGPLVGHYDGPAMGNDKVVCVTSAFARSTFATDWRTGQRWRDWALLPVHKLNHSEMKDKACPTSQLIDALYGPRNFNNPYTLGQECDNYATPPVSATSSATHAPSSASTATRDLASLETTPVTDPVPTADLASDDAVAESALAIQSVTAVEVSADGTGQLHLDPEDSARVLVELWSATPLEFDVTGSDGGVIENVTYDESEQDGAYLYHVDVPTSSEALLTLRGDEAVTVGVLTYVDSSSGLDTRIEATGPGHGKLTVTLDGFASDVVAASTVTATVPTADGQHRITLTRADDSDDGPEGVSVFSGEVPLNAGAWTPVDVTLTGPRSRFVTVGSVTADGTAEIFQATADRLTDTDGDGVVDTLEVEVPVHVSEAGTYQLAADFTTADGRTAFSAPASGTLEPGDGVLTLRAPIAALLAGGADGPYELTHGILTRTSGERVRVAESSEFGSVRGYPLADLPADQLALYGTVLSAGTGEAAGQLTATAQASVVTAGTYHLAGTITGPSGAKTSSATIDATLPAGLTTVELTFGEGSLSDGFGDYALTNLTIMPVDESEAAVIGAPARFVLEKPGGSEDPELQRPALRSQAPVTLTNSFQSVGASGDVVTAGDFACNSSTIISGDVIADGDVTMTNGCHVHGSVRAGGTVTLDSAAHVGSDVRAAGAVAMQSSARVDGDIMTGGDFSAIDGASIEQLQTTGSLGGSVLTGVPDLGPSVLAAIPVTGEPEWAGYATLTWGQWINSVAIENDAPTWSAARSDTPGCVMAPWASSVNGDSVRIAQPTVVDARAEQSGCPEGVTLQQMTLELEADLVIYADRFAAVNGLQVRSLDGAEHELRILVPDSAAHSSGSPSIILASGTSIDPAIRAQVVTAGTVELGGPLSMTGHVDAGSVVSHGEVTITGAGLTDRPL